MKMKNVVDTDIRAENGARFREIKWLLSPITIAIFSTAIVCVPLFSLHTIFAPDWINHLWLIEYFGEYFRRRWTLPEVINTDQLVGSPLTIFYGNKFYAMTGMVSALIGAAITIRLMVCSVLLLQFWQVYRAMAMLGAKRSISLMPAILCTWAIYSLTNLYNRSALTEFFAVAFLTCSLALLLRIVLAGHRKVDSSGIVLPGLMFALAAITHPLTGAFGAMLLAFVGGIGIIFTDRINRPWLIGFGALNALLTGLVLAPWLFVLQLFRGKLPVADPATNALYFRSQGFFPKSIDNFWSRISPLPLDLRSIQSGIQGVSTPYLDAQINVPLIVLACTLALVCAWQRTCVADARGKLARSIGWSCLLMGGFFLLVSVRPTISGWFGGFFDVLQFPYRLTAYVNLCAVAATISFGSIIEFDTERTRIFVSCSMAAGIALSFAGVVMKLVHAEAIATRVRPGQALMVARALITGAGAEDPTIAWVPQPLGGSGHLNRLPTTFYGSAAYTMGAGFVLPPSKEAVPRSHITFHTREGSAFGSVEPMTIELSQPKIVVTNVQPFAWNELVVNGVHLPQSQTLIADMEASGAWGSDYRLAVSLPAGRHQLQVAFTGNSTWRLLDRVSWAILLTWALVGFVLVIGKRRSYALWTSAN